MNTIAPEIVKLNGWTESDAIREIAAIDDIDEAEAKQRYLAALNALITRQVAAKTVMRMRKKARTDARNGFYNTAYAELYSSYRNAYWQERKKIEENS